MPNAAVSPVAGTSTVRAVAGLTNLVRCLYAYENVGVEAQAVAARALYAYENDGVQAQSIEARCLYLYENDGIEALEALARALYGYESTRDGEVFPWLMRIDPVEQYRGGQVDLYGDGLGELVEAAAGATITTSSVSGSDIGAGTVDRSTGKWVSTSGTGAWIRYAFGAPKTVVAIALEDLVSGSASWGLPEFRFSDGGANVAGAAAVPVPTVLLQTAEYPVGTVRALYTLPAPRTTTYVEIRIASGGSGTNRGLGEVWILEDLDQAAETSSAILNLGLPAEAAMGIVVWANRSPGLWPANGGVPITAAATVTVPVLGESGLVVVEETS